MGKRVPAATTAAADHGPHVTPTTRSIRKRRRGGASSNVVSAAKSLRLSGVIAAAATNNWHENDDEDSSSNDTIPALPMTPASQPARNQASSKHANNSSILLNASFNASSLTAAGDTSVNESPKPVYTLRPSVVNGTILYDLTQKPWRLGRPIGKGNFGEIFLASDNIAMPVTNENAKFVVKIEPHSNGPLFVEIHCLINTAKNNPNNDDEKDKIKNEKTNDKGSNNKQPPNQMPPSGIPDYIASGSHYFGDARYRFLVLQRFDRDLHSLIKNCRVHQKSVLTLAIQIVSVLERLHDKGYCHNDVKAQNLMISKCKYNKQKATNSATDTTASSNGSKSSNKIAATTETKATKNQQKKHYYDDKQPTTDSGNSSEQETNDNDNDVDYTVPKSGRSHEDEEEEEEMEIQEDDEDFDDGETTNSNNSNSMDHYKTPVNKANRKRSCIAAVRSSVPQVEFSGSNPVRSCRRQKRNSIYEEMVNSHYLRPTKRVSYSEFFNEDGISIKDGGRDLNNISVQIVSSDDDDSEEFVPKSERRRSSKKPSAAVQIISSDDDDSGEFVPKSERRRSSKKPSAMAAVSVAKRLTRRQEKLLGPASSSAKQQPSHHKKRIVSVSSTTTLADIPEWIAFEEERIFLIDFGLASKFMDNGVHRPFFMDQRRAHDGTLEFTSRDAHMGAHSRRSDLECLGYNLLFWSQGYLPWKEAAAHQQQEKVHRAKEYLMTDVREMLKQIYGKQVPTYLGEFLHHVGQLAYHERPDYAHYRRQFELEYQQLAGTGAGVAVVVDDMRLDSREIMRTCVRVKEEIENNKQNDLLEMNKRGDHNHVWSIMKNLSVGVGTPFHECTLSNRVSPKNLRSMSDKKTTIKKKKFTWAEMLSQDPDQIARERAEKEFDREEESDEVQHPTVHRYGGKPTYAILEIQQRLISSGRLPPVDYADVIDEEQEVEDVKIDHEKEEMNDEEKEEESADDADEDEEDEDDLVEKTHENDEQEDVEEKEEEEGEDIETDDAEDSKPEQKPQTNRRTRRNTRIIKTMPTNKKSSPKTANVGGRASGTRGSGKRAAESTTTIATRKRSSKASKASSGGKRGVDEIQHSTPKYLANGHHQNGGHVEKSPKRRTRRCLIKTDKAVVQNTATSEENSDDDIIAERSEESNSNSSAHSLFNVWKKINNETIYFRGGTVAATVVTRHCKK